jgi:hypothetical protein
MAGKRVLDIVILQGDPLPEPNHVGNSCWFDRKSSALSSYGPKRINLRNVGNHYMIEVWSIRLKYHQGRNGQVRPENQVS